MRPKFSKRAVVTVGMPYGNKGLHFGHIGGVFIPADCYARFLRDRIGAKNVLFVCGTDCYGSPIDEGYRKLKEENALTGTVLEYVEQNHKEQKTVLASYEISLDIYEGSGLGKSKAVHEAVTKEIITKLYQNGWLSLDTRPQFYDAQAKTFLNGRQVLGHCPVQGCKSQHAYADECDLGHQYRPEDLLNPKSSITGNEPQLRAVKNWYFDMTKMRDLLKEYNAKLREDSITRTVVSDTIKEFLAAPILYVKQEFFEDYKTLESQLPPHNYRPVEKGKASFEIEFTSLEERDKAQAVLSSRGIRLRSGKTLVPFRITGNIAWGVPAPAIEGIEDLTVWCWPESLWAPISFSKTWLDNQGKGIETLNPGSRNGIAGSWKDYWCSKDASVYQFIGQDNIYFYGVAQTALWAALNTQPPALAAFLEDGQLQQTKLVANYHLLFLDKKASSSGKIKPPMAQDLLAYYTVEQLRAHFIALGLSKKAVSFKPKPFDPAANEQAPDPVLRESALLTNVFNRLARSCFYEAQKTFDGKLPLAEIPIPVVKEATHAILAFEKAMYTTELYVAFESASEFIRQANKRWSDGIKQAGEDIEARREVLASSFYQLRVATVLMHPIVPCGTELIFEYLNYAVLAEVFFSWEHIFEGNEHFFSSEDHLHGGHPLKEVPPRFDFFEKHPSQR